MFYTPINGITWTIGGITTSQFGIKALLNYKNNRNPIARIYGWLGIALGIGLFFFGIPALLTNNTDALKYTYFLADLFVQLCIQIQVCLLWFLLLRSFVKLRYLLLISTTFSAVLLVIQFLTSTAMLSASHNLVIYQDKPIVLILKSIIYIGVSFPVGFFFLRQIPNSPTLRSKFKSLFSGLIFLILSTAATSNNLFDKGSDTVSSSLTLGVFFSLFIIVNSWPTKNLSTSKTKSR